MGVVNPVLQQRVDWPWFIVSQFVFGIAASIVVVRSEQIRVPPAGRGPEPAQRRSPAHSEPCSKEQLWQLRTYDQRFRPIRETACASLVSSRLVCLIGTAVGCCVGRSICRESRNRPTDRCRREDVMDFATLYATNCAACHGADGKLGPAPPLNDPLFRAIVPQRYRRTGRFGGPPGHADAGFRIARMADRSPPRRSKCLVYQIKGVRYKVIGEPTNGRRAAVKQKWSKIPAALRRCGARSSRRRPCAAVSGRRSASRAARAKDIETIRTGRLRASLRRMPRRHGEGTRTRRRDQQTGFPRAGERSDAAANHHHRPARSRHARLPSRETAAGRFQAA